MEHKKIKPFYFDWKLAKMWYSFSERNNKQKAWYKRNIEHGEVVVLTLEVDYILFNQTIFVQETPELMEKLLSIGFEPLHGFPDENLYESFSSIMYHKRFNVALSLYKPEYSYAVRTAFEIASGSIDSTVDSSAALVVFLSAVKQLIKSVEPTKKQTLLG